MALEKIMVMNVAAQLTAAVLQLQGKSATPIAIDPNIADPQLRAANLEGWEEFRIFYAGLIGALADDASFPPPKSGSLNVSGLLQGALPAILAQIPGAAGLVSQLTPLIQQLAPVLKGVLDPTSPVTLPANLPNPGMPTTTTGS